MTEKMHVIQLVLIRHGESQWNKENRFTGWIDVDLSDHGRNEAKQAAKILKEKEFFFDIGYSSVLKRAIHTLWIIMDELDQVWLPIQKTWRLNERHYGALQGMNKEDILKRYGIEQIKQWRRSFSVMPPKLNDDELLLLRQDPRYSELNFKHLPSAESLSSTLNRILPYWNQEIIPNIKNHKKLIISAHGNTIRAIIKFLKKLSEDEIFNLNIPTGVPIICEFNKHADYIKHYFLNNFNNN